MILRISAAILTFTCGLISIFSVIGPVDNHKLEILSNLFSFEFLEFSKFLTLILGFALVVSSINIYRQKKLAFKIVFGIACLSVVCHLVKNLDFESALAPFILMILLFYSREHFTVKSCVISLKDSLNKVLLLTLAAIAYGTVGFWLLEKSDLGFNFGIGDSLYHTICHLLFIGSEELVPQNAYAQWFLSSLSLSSLAIIGYTAINIYKPVRHKQACNKTLDPERSVVQKILNEQGRTALDYFKLWPDKSYYFSPSLKSFIAYRISGNYAVILGDPVGPEHELQDLVSNFYQFCVEHDWILSLFQVSPDLIDLYESLGFKKLKIGDEAIVDVANFNLEGSKKKDFRNRIRKMEKHSYYTKYYDAPLPDEVLVRLKQISNDWLNEPGRKERGFSLGHFEENYVRGTPIMTVEDENGVIVAFVNAIPSFRDGEISIDLMRKSKEAPSGVMDYLFVKFILHMQEQGYKTMNIGLAPMSGFKTHERASMEEFAVHSVFQRLNFLFNYVGLKVFKAKFADHWEPRYLIFKESHDLPGIAWSINNVLEKV